MDKNAGARKLESGDASTAGYSPTFARLMQAHDTRIPYHPLPHYRHGEAHNWFTDNWLRDRPRLCVTSVCGRDSFLAVLQERDDRASARALVAIPSPVKCCLCFDRVRMRASVTLYLASSWHVPFRTRRWAAPPRGGHPNLCSRPVSTPVR